MHIYISEIYYTVSYIHRNTQVCTIQIYVCTYVPMRILLSELSVWLANTFCFITYCSDLFSFLNSPPIKLGRKWKANTAEMQVDLYFTLVLF